jgi:hypothetical protein
LEVFSLADGVSFSPNSPPCEIVLKKTGSAVHMAPSNFGAIPVSQEFRPPPYNLAPQGGEIPSNIALPGGEIPRKFAPPPLETSPFL